MAKMKHTKESQYSLNMNKNVHFTLTLSCSTLFLRDLNYNNIINIEFVNLGRYKLKYYQGNLKILKTKG